MRDFWMLSARTRDVVAYILLLDFIFMHRECFAQIQAENIPSWMVVPERMAGFPIYMPQQPVFASHGSSDFANSWGDYRWSNFYEPTIVAEPKNDSIWEHFRDFLAGRWTIPPPTTTTPSIISLIANISELGATAQVSGAPVTPAPALLALIDLLSLPSGTNASTKSAPPDNVKKAEAANTTAAPINGTTSPTKSEETSTPDPFAYEVPDNNAVVQAAAQSEDQSITASPDEVPDQEEGPPQEVDSTNPTSNDTKLTQKELASFLPPAATNPLLSASANAGSPFILPTPQPLISGSGVGNPSALPSASPLPVVPPAAVTQAGLDPVLAQAVQLLANQANSARSLHSRNGSSGLTTLLSNLLPMTTLPSVTRTKADLRRQSGSALTNSAALLPTTMVPSVAGTRTGVLLKNGSSSGLKNLFPITTTASVATTKNPNDFINLTRPDGTIALSLDLDRNARKFDAAESSGLTMASLRANSRLPPLKSKLALHGSPNLPKPQRNFGSANASGPAVAVNTTRFLEKLNNRELRRLLVESEHAGSPNARSNSTKKKHNRAFVAANITSTFPSADRTSLKVATKIYGGNVTAISDVSTQLPSKTPLVSGSAVDKALGPKLSKIFEEYGVCVHTEGAARLGICVERANVEETCDGMLIKRTVLCPVGKICCVPLL